MRRNRIVAAAFAGTSCLIAFAAPAATAVPNHDFRRPEAHVHPHEVSPGEIVTVVVKCGWTGWHGGRGEEGHTIWAHSDAFSRPLPLDQVGGRHHHGGEVFVGRTRIEPHDRDYGGGEEGHGREHGRHEGREHGRNHGGDDGFGRGGDDSFGRGGEGGEGGFGRGGGEGFGRGGEGDEGGFGRGGGEGFGRGGDERNGAQRTGEGEGYEERFQIGGRCPGGRHFETFVIVHRHHHEEHGQEEEHGREEHGQEQEHGQEEHGQEQEHGQKSPGHGVHAGQGGALTADAGALASGGALLAAAAGGGTLYMRRRNGSRSES